MPKIDVHDTTFFSLLGVTYSEAELIDVLTTAKAEVDDWLPEENLLKIELNDTNRPDLWSTRGLVRQLNVYRDGGIPEYDFFSRAGDARKAQEAQQRLNRLLDVLKMGPPLAGYKAGLALRGMPIGGLRPPLRDMTPEEHARFEKAFEAAWKLER